MYPFRNSDAHLVSQVLRGQKDRYAQLVERYLPAVQAVARANAGSHADADDIAQDTFIDAFRRLDTLREASKFGHWLMRIARNKACDWAAAEIRERTKRAAGGEVVQGGQGAATPEQRELYDLLHRELEAMPPEQREVLALFHFAGHRTQEIAGMLGLSNAAVRKRLQRGREALGERMLARMEGVDRDPEATRGRARTIYGAAVGIPAAWEAHGAAAGVGGAGLFASAVSGGALIKGTVVALLCVVLGGTYWGLYHSRGPAAAGEETVTAALRAAFDLDTDLPASGAEAGLSSAGADPGGGASLPSGEGILFGTVFGVDDRPVADTAVHLYLINGSVVYPPQVSDEQGRFRFEGVPADNTHYALWAVSPDGQTAATLWEVMMEGHPISQRFLELEPAHPVTGLVVDPGGSPIAGAKVVPLARQASERTAPERTLAVEPVYTDDNGRFAVPYLAAGFWQFWAKAEGFAPTWFGPVAGGADAGSITLFRGNTLTGTLVSGESREAVAGVEVILVDDGEPMQPPRLMERATTGPDGQFAFADLPSLRVRVYTEAGWIAEPVALTLEEGVSLPSIPLSALPGASVRGQVVAGDHGGGVADLNVTLREQLRAPRTALTDDEGRYAFSGLPAGDYTVSVTANVTPRSRARMLGLGDVAEGLDFTTQQGTIQVSGRVVDATGSPLAGVRVEAFDQSEVMAPRTRETDASGAFTFAGLPPVEFLWIRGHMDGWKSKDLNPTDLRDDVGGLELVMEPIAGLSGRLIDQRGKPVAGVSLSARATTHQQYSSRGAKSTARGRFAFPNLVSGAYTVYAQADNGPSMRLGDVNLAPGENKADVVLSYAPEPGLAISGRIADGNDEPVPAAMVNLRTAGGGGQMSVTSDREGRFSFIDLDAGLYEVVVQGIGYSKTTISEVLAGTEELEVAMVPVARVNGRVLAADGRPLDAFFVRWLDGARSEITHSERERSVGVNDVRGHFTLADVNAGTITAVAWAEGWAPAFATLELNGGETRSGVELRLEAAEPVTASVTSRARTALHGLVTGARKEPIAGAYIYLDHRPHATERTGEARAITGPDGRFVLEGVPLSTERLLAWHKDYAPAGVALSLSDKAVHEVTVSMTPGGTLEGTLRGGGQPLRDAQLSVDSMVLGQRFYDNIYSDAKGYYRAEHVVAGNTAINVHYKERWYKFSVRVSEGATTTSDIDLQIGTAAIDGTLLNDGEPVEGQITVMLPVPGGGEERFTQQTTTNGRFYLDGLPEGTVKLEGRAADGEVGTLEIEGAAGEVMLVEIDLLAAIDE